MNSCQTWCRCLDRPDISFSVLETRERLACYGAHPGLRCNVGHCQSVPANTSRWPSRAPEEVSYGSCIKLPLRLMLVVWYRRMRASTGGRGVGGGGTKWTTTGACSRSCRGGGGPEPVPGACQGPRLAADIERSGSARSPSSRSSTTWSTRAPGGSACSPRPPQTPTHGSPRRRICAGANGLAKTRYTRPIRLVTRAPEPSPPTGCWPAPTGPMPSTACSTPTASTCSPRPAATDCVSPMTCSWPAAAKPPSTPPPPRP